MATDQEIRDAGLYTYLKQKYLQNPYNLPVAPPAYRTGTGWNNKHKCFYWWG